MILLIFSLLMHSENPQFLPNNLDSKQIDKTNWFNGTLFYACATNTNHVIIDRKTTLRVWIAMW